MSSTIFASSSSLHASNRMLLSSSPRKWLGSSSTLHLAMLLQAKCLSKFASSVSASNFSVSTIGSGHIPNVYVTHSFYKGKSALSMSPGRPIFKPLETGNAVIERQGCMFLGFAPAVGLRQYDWKQKQVFALSVAELGALVALLPTESCEFYHDPYMGKSDAGKVRKVLKVEPTPDKSGFFFNLSVSNRLENMDVRISIPMTKAEFTLMKSAFNFIIPYLMGWHALINPALLYPLQMDKSITSDLQGCRSVNTDPDGSLEWET